MKSEADNPCHTYAGETAETTQAVRYRRNKKSYSLPIGTKMAKINYNKKGKALTVSVAVKKTGVLLKHTPPQYL